MSSYRAPAAVVFLAWKHSRQNTGRPCVGLNGTVVSLPHCEQLVRVSTRAKLWLATAVGPKFDDRLALQPLHRLGSFLNCLSKKNSCSPAVKMKSAPQSMHFNTLSWNSIGDAPFRSFPLHLFTGKHGSFRRAKTHQELGHIPLKWLDYPGFGPPCSITKRGHCLQRTTTASY